MLTSLLSGNCHQSPSHHMNSSVPPQAPALISGHPAPPVAPTAHPMIPPAPPVRGGLVVGVMAAPKPPPMPNFSNSTASEPISGLAAELQARLKKMSLKAAEKSVGITGSNGTSGEKKYLSFHLVTLFKFHGLHFSPWLKWKGKGGSPGNWYGFHDG